MNSQPAPPLGSQPEVQMMQILFGKMALFSVTSIARPGIPDHI